MQVSISARRLLTAVVAVSLLITCFVGPSLSEVRRPDLAVYAAIEPVIHRDYERQAGVLKRAFEEHREEFRKIVERVKGRSIRGNWMDQIEDAHEWIKMFNYNRASMAVACAEKAKLDAAAITKGDSPEFNTVFLPCFKEQTDYMLAFVAADNTFIVSEHQGKEIILSTDKFASECEPSARQVDREKALEPYEFLQTKKPASLRLMSFFVYNTCRNLKAYQVAFDAAFPDLKKK